MGKPEPSQRLRPAAGEQQASLYADRQKVYPQAVRGPVRRAKWAILLASLALYYITPWLRWDRGANVPNQAVLVDMTNGRLFFFWIEIWPQEVYFLTGLLVLAAIGLFAATSLFGRVWCGFACPQTVWTDLFMHVERWIQGDRNARMRLDKQPWSGTWIAKKVATHAVWLLIAAATGGAWVAYFNDAPTLAREFFIGGAGQKTYFFFGLFTATTYLLAGWAREQVCTYMCPWPRFQAAMLDEDSLVVSYRAWRGEPRGKARSAGTGDCIDCHACVNVCPTGIDIRDGQQLECIGCGLCIDACDDIMAKLHRPQGLVAFETLRNVALSANATAAMTPGAERDACGMAARRHPKLLRTRTLLYAGVLSLVTAVMLGAFLLRDTLHLSVLRDRAPLFVQLADGGIRNAYTLKLVNKTRDAGALSLVVDAPQGIQLLVQDAGQDQAGRPQLTLRPDGITQWRALLTAPASMRLPESTPVTFRLLDTGGRSVEIIRSVFLAPRS